MMLFLLSLGLVLMALAFLVSARMSKATPFADRLGAAIAGATGLMLIFATTARPDLLMPSLVALLVCAVWFAAAPPAELARAPERDSGHWRREDA